MITHAAHTFCVIDMCSIRISDREREREREREFPHHSQICKNNHASWRLVTIKGSPKFELTKPFSKGHKFGVSMESLPQSTLDLGCLGSKAAWHHQCHYLLIPWNDRFQRWNWGSPAWGAGSIWFWSHTWFTGYIRCIVYWCILKTCSSIHSDSILSSHASGCACGSSVLRWFDDFSKCYICYLTFL